MSLNHPSSHHTLLLRNARLAAPGDAPPQTCDIAIADGRVVGIADSIDATAHLVLDCGGRLVTPPLVESHIHLDSVFTDDGRLHGPASNLSGTLFEGIALWGRWKHELTRDAVVEHAMRAIRQLVSLGVLHIRTHVDVSEPTLKLLDALLDVRQRIRDFAELQVVAFPQDGLFFSSRGMELLEEAMRRGADVVGGIPHGEPTREDGVRSVHACFDLAARFDKPIDLHCDEVDDPQSRFIETVLARALSDGVGPRVAASHTTAMGSYDNSYADRLLRRLEGSGLNFIANPLVNIHLQGRNDNYPKRRGLTRVAELLQHGVNVSLGHDCIQDPWYCLGTGNLLDVAHMVAHVCHLMTLPQIHACFDMVCWKGAITLGIDGDRFGIDVDHRADLVVHDAASKFDAVRKRLPPRWVISRGKIVAETTSARPIVHV
jgi:cytosine deaminase